MNLWRKLANLLPSRRHAEELDMREELEILKSLADPNELGNLTLVAENARAELNWIWLEQFGRDVQYAIRTLRKYPNVTLVVVVTMALGIGATTSMFSVINSVLLQPLNFDRSDRVVAIWESSPKHGFDKFSVSVPNFTDWQIQNSVFTSMAAYDRQSVTLTGLGEADRVQIAKVSADFFDVVQGQALVGRTLTIQDAEQRNPVAVISHDLWLSSYGGEPSMIGSGIVLDGNSYTVVGVMPKHFMFPADTEVWAPLPPLATSRGRHNITAIARLKEGVTLEAAAAQMKTIASNLEQEYPDSNESSTAIVSYLRDDTVKDLRGTLVVLLGAVGFVLLIACSNSTCMLLAQAGKRYREMAVRSALGASQVRLLRQLLTESIVLSLISGVLGIAAAYAGLHFLLLMAPANLPRIHETEMSWPVLAFGIVLAVVTGVIFGILPALQLLRGASNDGLKESHATSGVFYRHLRSAFTIAAIALTIIVTTGAGLMLQSIESLHGVNAGFDGDNVLTLQLNLPETRYGDPEQRVTLMEQLLRRFKQIPGVVHVASTNALPLSETAFNDDPPEVGFSIEGTDLEERPSAQIRFVTPEYFQTLRIPTVQGREFTDADRRDKPRVAIVNQAFARQMFPDSAPLGRTLVIGGLRHEIVGIARDTKDDHPRRQARPMYYLPFLQQGANVNILTAKVRFLVRSKENNPQALAASLRSEIKLADDGIAIFDVHTMDEISRLSLARERFTTAILVIFALIGLLLAAVGLYGVIAHAVSQRTREFSIRIALGAQRGEVLNMVLRQMILLCGSGALLGIVGVLSLSGLMRSLVFNVAPADPVTILGAVFTLIAAATAAVFVPALRATRLDPAVALRDE